ncbi:MAG: hypothetical protein GVY25_14230 [Bacteroidetes bacterium]|jgi:hypothetical protein|nr:hypothetical protein [Bacteroidota bacterium]
MVVSWSEAEKEIRILCSTFVTGQPLEAVIATLETGHYLRYRVCSEAEHPVHVRPDRTPAATSTDGPDAGIQWVVVNSYYNGLRSSCTITVDDGLVSAARLVPAPD